jgi:imidazolonepropionase-like amidohydrolase
MESWDAIPENSLLVRQAGVPVATHSDSANTVQRLYTDAAKLVAAGMAENDALATITLDPARLLGVAAKVGSLEVGKDADLALFSRHPLDTYTLVDATWIDGALVFDRATEGTPDAQP